MFGVRVTKARCSRVPTMDGKITIALVDVQSVEKLESSAKTPKVRNRSISVQLLNTSNVFNLLEKGRNYLVRFLRMWHYISYNDSVYE